MRKCFILLLMLVSFTVPAFANSYTNLANNSTNTISRVHKDQTVFDYTGSVSGYPIYTGHAVSGAATSSDAWRVCRATDSVDGPTAIKCVDGIWDDRASLTYA